jgi:hypothetical protein
MKHSLARYALCLFALFSISWAETHIFNDIGDKTFDETANPIIVDQEVTIGIGKKVVFKEGCVLVFKAFTGLTVKGSLIVEGSPAKPVVFTSINDAKYNPQAEQLPNPFDWNGIQIPREAGEIKMRNFQLMYSVFGIKSQKDDITIQNGLFQQNGQFHLTVNDKILFVQDNISYSYNTVDSTAVNPKPDGAQKKKKSPKAIAAAALAVVGVAACGVGAYYYLYDAEKKYDTYMTEDGKNTYSEYESSYQQGIAGFVGAGVAFPVAGVLLWWNFAKDKSAKLKLVTGISNEGGTVGLVYGF